MIEGALIVTLLLASRGRGRFPTKHAAKTAGRLAYVAGVTAATTFASAPIVRQLMLRTGTMDVPNHRSSHTVPIPRAGGLSGLAGLAVVGALHELPQPAKVLPAVLLGAIGLADDTSGGLPATTRLALQVGLGAVVGRWLESPIGPFAGALCLPGVVNVVNFMDGINGISGLTAVVFGTNVVLAGDADDMSRIVGAVILGIGAGFLPWNAPTAQIFLGDVGSYSLGGLMAIAAATAGSSRSAALVLVPLLPYAADAAQAIVRRARAGDPLLEAHREHAYQKLVDVEGLSHSKVALLHAMSAASVAMAWHVLTPAKAAAATGLVLTAYTISPQVFRWMRDATQHRGAEVLPSQRTTRTSRLHRPTFVPRQRDRDQDPIPGNGALA